MKQITSGFPGGPVIGEGSGIVTFVAWVTAMVQLDPWPRNFHMGSGMNTYVTNTTDKTYPAARNAITHATNPYRQHFKLPVLSIDF